KLSTLLATNVVRDVEIISLGKVGGEKSPVWKVDFKVNEVSYNSENGNSNLMVLKTHYWTASLTAAFIPARMFMAKRLMNPLGFTVLRYSQTEVEIL
ncbi:MAG: type IV secretion system protein, partial [Alphaproteobacteria bacterium]|nr:type IV secretion system protein [Alphaproteobacteria bacterium]